MRVWMVLSLSMFMLMLTGAAAQAPPPPLLEQCQSLLRIKQETCHCQQIEQLASQILLRAERAEAEVRTLRQQLPPPPPEGSPKQP